MQAMLITRFSNKPNPAEDVGGGGGRGQQNIFTPNSQHSLRQAATADPGLGPQDTQVTYRLADTQQSAFLHFYKSIFPACDRWQVISMTEESVCTRETLAPLVWSSAVFYTTLTCLSQQLGLKCLSDTLTLMYICWRRLFELFLSRTRLALLLIWILSKETQKVQETTKTYYRPRSKVTISVTLHILPEEYPIQTGANVYNFYSCSPLSCLSAWKGPTHTVK